MHVAFEPGAGFLQPVFAEARYLCGKREDVNESLAIINHGACVHEAEAARRRLPSAGKATVPC